MSLILSIWTVVVFVIFIGIVFWAYSSKRKEGFDEAARLPLEDLNDDGNLSDSSLTEKHNG